MKCHGYQTANIHETHFLFQRFRFSKVAVLRYIAAQFTEIGIHVNLVTSNVLETSSSTPQSSSICIHDINVGTQKYVILLGQYFQCPTTTIWSIAVAVPKTLHLKINTKKEYFTKICPDCLISNCLFRKLLLLS